MRRSVSRCGRSSKIDACRRTVRASFFVWRCICSPLGPPAGAKPLAGELVQRIDNELQLGVEIRCRVPAGVDVAPPPTVERARRHARELRRLRSLLLGFLAELVRRARMIRRPAIGLLALVFRRLAGLSSDNLVNDSEGRLSARPAQADLARLGGTSDVTPRSASVVAPAFIRRMSTLRSTCRSPCGSAGRGS